MTIFLILTTCNFYMLFCQVYNVVDSGDTTQGHLSSIISEIFDINHDYWGTAFSTLAKVGHYYIYKSIFHS
jgi:hypothetical protein